MYKFWTFISSDHFKFSYFLLFNNGLIIKIRILRLFIMNLWIFNVNNTFLRLIYKFNFGKNKKFILFRWRLLLNRIIISLI